MKMKINKACDLSSISVLPPHTRRTSGVNNGSESSIFGRSQAASHQLRAQQQSFSQGVSSQLGTFSQLTQNSPDNIAMNDQRFGSQERENSTKRLSLFQPINNTREESQIQLSRSSTGLMRKWNAPDQKCQISEELDLRLGMMETSLSRFGMILNSVQSDIMQINKGKKEAALELEIIREKLNLNGNALQLMHKGQEDVKVSLDRAVNSIHDQLGQYAYQESLQKIFSLLSVLPEKIEVCIRNLQNDLSKSFSKESQDIKHHAIPQARPLTKNSIQSAHRKVQQAPGAAKIEMGTWNSVKHKQATFTNRNFNKKHKQKEISPTELERNTKINFEQDEEINREFFCYPDDEETGNFSIQEAREETEQILRKARRRKRKYCNTIIID